VTQARTGPRTDRAPTRSTHEVVYTHAWAPITRFVVGAYAPSGELLQYAFDASVTATEGRARATPQQDPSGPGSGVPTATDETDPTSKAAAVRGSL
jgi:hypothetical protein